MSLRGIVWQAETMIITELMTSSLLSEESKESRIRLGVLGVL